MSTYRAPLADMRFVLFDLLKVETQYARLPGGENATRDTVDAILDEAAKFSEQVLAEFIAPLAAAAKEWGELTQAVGQRAAANADEVGAASVDYLFYSGYVTLAYFWARSVAAADASTQPDAFKQGKRHTARFYFARILPRTRTHASAIRSGADTLTAMPDALFG